MAIIVPKFAKSGGKGCKWCSQGQCWTHGGGKGAVKQTMFKQSPGFRKGGGKGGWGGGKGAGQWVLVQGSGKGFGKSYDPKKEAFNKSMDKLSKVEAERKVWIGGLPKKVDWKTLEKHIQEITGNKPKITEVMKKGTGCCAFADADAAQAAIAAANGSELDGQAIEVDVWTEQEKTEGEEKPKRKLAAVKTSWVDKEAFNRSMDKLSKVDAEKKVWIGGLSDKVTWKTLEKHMQEITGSKPKITEVMKKGTGCCAFADADAAQAAIAAANGSELNGQAIEVDVWTKSEKTEKKGKKAKVE